MSFQKRTTTLNTFKENYSGGGKMVVDADNYPDDLKLTVDDGEDKVEFFLSSKDMPDLIFIWLEQLGKADKLTLLDRVKFMCELEKTTGLTCKGHSLEE